MTTGERRVHLDGRDFTLHLPTKTLDELVDALDDDALDRPDAQLPYWSHLWPASIALAQHLLQSPPPGPTLELGCGAGLAGLAARAAGAPNVLQTDREPEALELARAGAQASGLADRISWRVVDWNAPPGDLGRWPHIIAADVLYETAFVAPLLALIDATLTDDGIALIADPCRGTAEDGISEARGRFVVTTLRAPVTVDGQTLTIAIHELRR